MLMASSLGGMPSGEQVLRAILGLRSEFPLPKRICQYNYVIDSNYAVVFFHIFRYLPKKAPKRNTKDRVDPSMVKTSQRKAPIPISEKHL